MSVQVCARTFTAHAFSQVYPGMYVCVAQGRNCNCSSPSWQAPSSSL